MKLTDNARTVLERRYLARKEDGSLETPEDMLWRVARNIAEVDQDYGATSVEVEKLAQDFFDMMDAKDFLPNSPTLRNAGRELQQLSACYVLPVEDDLEGIFETLKMAAMVHKSGGGTGYSFSRLRPKGDQVSSTGNIAGGPISFMKVFNAASQEVTQGGIRMGANMAVLRVDHPDIMEFIHCKDNPSTLPAFNISVGITDEFMSAVKDNKTYNLYNPRDGEFAGTIDARHVLREIAECAWRTGDPGILFLDEINEHNPTPHLGDIEATNPCGEVPLLPNESCNLGSINLSNMVIFGKTDKSYIPNWGKIRDTVKLAVHFLDNVIDANLYTHPHIEVSTKATRKIGLGVMGWADMLVKMGVQYDSEEALNMACDVMEFINDTARRASEKLAEYRGPYPECVDDTPRRNATVTTIAPTGTISIIAGCSSGIEPYFALVYERGVIYDEDGPTEMIQVVESSLEEYTREHAMFYDDEFLANIISNGGSIRGLGLGDIEELFPTANEVDYEWHVKTQAAFQKHIENAISKTVNLPNTATYQDIYDAILLAHNCKCKGITVYRDGCREDQVINWSVQDEEEPAPVQMIEGARSRPESTAGHTERVVVGCGRKLFITVNEDEEGLFEVFMNVGKGGGCIASHTEALGRMISLSLRNYVEPDEIVEQLAGIRCPYIQWNKEGTPYTSCADAVAKVIAKYSESETAQATIKELRLYSNSPECPECGAPLVYQEGCSHCTTCGYTMC